MTPVILRMWAQFMYEDFGNRSEFRQVCRRTTTSGGTTTTRGGRIYFKSPFYFPMFIFYIYLIFLLFLLFYFLFFVLFVLCLQPPMLPPISSPPSSHTLQSNSPRFSSTAGHLPSPLHQPAMCSQHLQLSKLTPLLLLRWLFLPFPSLFKESSCNSLPHQFTITQLTQSQSWLSI